MELPGVSDEELVDRCLDGDEEAWAALLHRYRRLMYSVPRRFGFSAERCDEVFQRTSVSMIRSLRNLREVKRLAGWIAATATNHARMLLREEKKSTELDPEAAAAGGDVAGLLRGLEDSQILAAGLDRLDTRCRTLLDLMFFAAGRVTYEQMSERLGMPVGSLGPTRIRCLERLKKLLLGMGFSE
jgi:RNA polymerase sigma factor (sigma-70 family)